MRAVSNLPVEAFNGIVGADMRLMLKGESHVGEPSSPHNSQTSCGGYTCSDGRDYKEFATSHLTYFSNSPDGLFSWTQSVSMEGYAMLCRERGKVIC